MRQMFRQGDVLIERVEDAPVSGTPVAPHADGAVVLAEGEATGHRHAFYGGNVVMFRDDALARDMQDASLYIGHIRIEGKAEELRHEEHDPIRLALGTYRIRRQREFDSQRARLVMD